MSDINKLERIKQAYYSGLKVQIWFNGHWENFDARDYSMYADPFSENRQYRIVGSAYADIAEKRIAELEKENAELKAINEGYCRSRDRLASIGLPTFMSCKETVNKLKEAKELVEKYRQAVDKCLHITFMGGGCEVNTIGQYATLVDGYLTDIEGLAKWKN